MNAASSLRFDPMLPWWLIVALAGVALLVASFALWRGLRGWAWRGLAGLATAAALTGPALEIASRSGLSDIVILLDDRSASQSLPGRNDQTDAAIESMTREITSLPNTELRRVTLGDSDEGSLIGTTLSRAIAAEPDNRIAGIIAVTDGQAHDPALIPGGAPAPVHTLLTGRPEDWDRRLVIDEAPAFGLIDQTVTIRVRIEDQGTIPDSLLGRPANLRISVDGGDEQVLAIPPGVPMDVPVTLGHAGQNVVQIGFDAPEVGSGVEPELTDRNNAAAITVTGVRDRLRVLLVSGEPHAGERTWRNLLKSDAAVDLIHFTILRPPDKSDGVPVNELSLIAFPTRELFMERIQDFDLIIFDRYRVRGILPPSYFDNIATYVENGGAILVAAGPEMASVESLNLSPLGRILPASPTGQVIDAPFTPQLTDQGRRHPVTAGLPGAPAADNARAARDQTWGRWLRLSEVVPQRGEVVMTDQDNHPLLIFDRVGEGRVAQLTSDQVWLWGRGFEGGGPQLELLRRIAHWSMKEPELEEEALEADVSGGLDVRLTRRTMQETAGPLQITGPDGYELSLPLEQVAPGRLVADWSAPEPGLYRLRDGDTISRVIALGPAAPREFEATVASDALLGPLAADTGGTVLRLADGVPQIRAVRPGRQAYGRGVGGEWIGITPREASTVTGLSRRPLLPGWAWLALISGLILAGWLSEGRRMTSFRTTG